jgi:hypothetical protein
MHCSAAMGHTAVRHHAITAALKGQSSAPYHNNPEHVYIDSGVHARQHCMYAQQLTAALPPRSMHGAVSPQTHLPS